MMKYLCVFRCVQLSKCKGHNNYSRSESDPPIWGSRASVAFPLLLAVSCRQELVIPPSSRAQSADPCKPRSGRHESVREKTNTSFLSVHSFKTHPLMWWHHFLHVLSSESGKIHYGEYVRWKYTAKHLQNWIIDEMHVIPKGLLDWKQLRRFSARTLPGLRVVCFQVPAELPLDLPRLRKAAPASRRGAERSQGFGALTPFSP